MARIPMLAMRQLFVLSRPENPSGIMLPIWMPMMKVDNILVKSNNAIGKFGEKLLDTRIPVSIRQEAFAFAGGIGLMPAFSVESKTLREVMHFSSKHADDVVRGVAGSGRAERVTQAVNNMSEFFETEFG